MADATSTAPPGRFRLLRFFALATLLPFAAAGLALYLLQEAEETYFFQVQREQQQALADAQAELARLNHEAARRGLLAVHEAGHVNLTRMVANTLWASDIAPLVAAAQRLPVEPCRALAGDRRRVCQAEIGQRIRALPGFEALDRKAAATMRGTTVFKMKVFDLRGVTVYSSEPRQVGEDGVGNLGWRQAAAGRPASELTHRARFSAFEGVVENRDLISTYVPVRDGTDGPVAGVFELYSDVTPFLEQLEAASRDLAANIAGNQAEAALAAQRNQDRLERNSLRFLGIVGGLVLLLYGSALAVVRFGQRFIDRQSLAQEQAARREQQWHREKMSALAAMAENVAHEVGNPLAVIAGVAQALPDRASAQPILEQAGRIAQMMRKIADFAGADAEAPRWVEVNPLLEAVCGFQGFDRRFRDKPIRFLPGAGLPAVELTPDHLNEVVMNLLQMVAGLDAGAAVRGIDVATQVVPAGVAIEFRCPGEPGAPAPDLAALAADHRFEPTRRRVLEMGGTLELETGRVRMTLPGAAT